MGKETGIKWTDSTWNSWWGCTKVGPACDHCYAEGVDALGTPKEQAKHWGHGAPRRLLSEHARNEPFRWNRNADKFFAEHGRRQRVFTLSMGDLFDNEVSDAWRGDHMETMVRCDRLEWQICTKRVSNVAKMVPPHWEPEYGGVWPQHIGLLVTIVTQAEADRDVPRLLELKKRFGIPWVGISYEPAQELVDFTCLNREPDAYDRAMPGFADCIAVYTDALTGAEGIATQDRCYETVPKHEKLDWIIFGGKSGPQWNDRPFNIDWARSLRDDCAEAGTAFFMKQVAASRPTDAMIPADLLIRQWPKGH